MTIALCSLKFVKLNFFIFLSILFIQLLTFCEINFAFFHMLLRLNSLRQFFNLLSAKKLKRLKNCRNEFNRNNIWRKAKFISLWFLFRIRFYIKCRLKVNLLLFIYMYFYLKATVKKFYHDGFNS